MDIEKIKEWIKRDRGGTPEDMNTDQIISYLKEQGQHFTCDHNSNFDQGICETAAAFIAMSRTAIPELVEEVERLENEIAKEIKSREEAYSYYTKNHMLQDDMADLAKENRRLEQEAKEDERSQEKDEVFNTKIFNVQLQHADFLQDQITTLQSDLEAEQEKKNEDT